MHIVCAMSLMEYINLWLSGAMWRHSDGLTLTQAMACCLYNTKPLPEPMLNCHQRDSLSGIHSKAMLTWILMMTILRICFEFAHSKSQPHLTRSYELRAHNKPVCCQHLLQRYCCTVTVRSLSLSSLCWNTGSIMKKKHLMDCMENML